jgi:hypothetical protein
MIDTITPSHVVARPMRHFISSRRAEYMTAVITVLVGLTGLIIGWYVSGYQKVTEKLTEERRAAYLKLLREADKANQSPTADRAALESSAFDARFISSHQMMISGRIEALLKAVATEGWEGERERFLWLARYESLNNSQWGRRLRWREYGISRMFA